MLPAAAPPLRIALPPRGPRPAVLRRDGGAGTAGGGCAGAGSAGVVSAGLDWEAGQRGCVRGMPGRAAARRGCGEAQALNPSPGTRCVSPGPVARGAHAPGWPHMGPRARGGAARGWDLGAFDWLAWLGTHAGRSGRADLRSPPHRGLAPASVVCGASHAWTPPWKFTSEVAPALVEAWGKKRRAGSPLGPLRAGVRLQPESPFCVSVAGSSPLSRCRAAVRP